MRKCVQDRITILHKRSTQCPNNYWMENIGKFYSGLNNEWFGNQREPQEKFEWLNQSCLPQERRTNPKKVHATISQETLKHEDKGLYVLRYRTQRYVWQVLPEYKCFSNTIFRQRWIIGFARIITVFTLETINGAPQFWSRGLHFTRTCLILRKVGIN